MPKPPRPSASEVLRHNLLILVGLLSHNLWVYTVENSSWLTPGTYTHYSTLSLLVQEQGLKNFEFGDTQYAQGLTSDYYRGDPGDCP